MSTPNQSPDGRYTIFSDDEVMALNLRQAGIGLSDPRQRVVCTNASDGKHEILGGALGNMIAAPAYYVCPFCDHQLAPIDTAPELVRSALAAESFLAPDGHTLLLAQERMKEFKSVGDRGGHNGLAYVMVTFLQRYTEHASKRMRPKWGGMSIEAFPLELLLRLHNLAEPGSAVRREVIDWLHGQRALKERQHWLDAITIAPSGDLIFDSARHTYAAWRGKQETYFASALKGLEAVKDGLSSVARFQQEEEVVKAALPDMGEPLFRERQLLPEVAALKLQADRLEQMLSSLKACGLADLLTAAPQVHQLTTQD